MALPGFELLYSSVAQQIRHTDDAAITAVHWNLITHGLKCCGNGETWPDGQSQNISGSEALPQGWNDDSNIYALRYVDPTSNRTYLMKALAMDGSLMLHFVRCFDEKASSITICSRDFVNSDMSNVNRAFSNLSGLNSTLTSELYQKLMGAGSQNSNPATSTSQPQRRRSPPGQDTRSPLMEDPRRGLGGGVGYIPPRHPLASPFQDPFGVGGADLDPFGSGRGGGMFMDPRNFPQGGGLGPRLPHGGVPPGFPPGSIPPGARFDPVGPAGIRPDPDPDHERPPGYDDMFM